jgi:hypothetical protein
MRLGSYLALVVLLAGGASCGSGESAGRVDPKSVQELPLSFIDSAGNGAGRITIELAPLADVGTVSLELMAGDEKVGEATITGDFQTAKKIGFFLYSGGCAKPNRSRVLSFDSSPIPNLEVPQVSSIEIPSEWGFNYRVEIGVTFKKVSDRRRYVSVLGRNPSGDEFGNLIVVPAGDLERGAEFDLDKSFGLPNITYVFYDVNGTFCGDSLV